ncbi:MAG: rRNA maturation RNase YbeY [Oligoflexus sp.]
MESDSSSLQISIEQKTYLIHQPVIDEIVQHICLWLGIDQFEVSVEFVEPEVMRELNREYRQKDRSTDVLSFPQQEWDAPLSLEQPFQASPRSSDDAIPELLGDLVISPADAEANARGIGHSIDREVCFLLIHGILHLCGHDHMEAAEEELMTKQQQLIIQRLEELRPEPIWNHCVRIK